MQLTDRKLELDERKILVNFDDLVSRGVILFGPEKVVRVVDGGFEFEVRVCPTLQSKPTQIGDVFKPEPDRHNTTIDESLTFGPGSDLVNADPGLLVTKVHDEHILVLNRFCVFRPQYLLLTIDSYRRQTTSLDKSDLISAWTVLNALQMDSYIMYNCGEAAGCSRLHKHMQILPRPEGFTFFPDKPDFDSNIIPYRYFLRYLDNNSVNAGEDAGNLISAHEELLLEAKQAQGVNTDDDSISFPHNVMLTKRWIMVIPRQQVGVKAVQGVTANGAGMLGLVWVLRDEQLEHWKSLAPRKILSQLGFPS